jgi:hypothetical protein
MITLQLTSLVGYFVVAEICGSVSSLINSFDSRVTNYRVTVDRFMEYAVRKNIPKRLYILNLSFFDDLCSGVVNALVYVYMLHVYWLLAYLSA